MKWIVGVDLRPRSQGALHVSKWLLSHSRERVSLQCLHILEEDHLQATLRYHHLDDLLAGARKASDAVVAEVGISSDAASIEIIQAITADVGLETARRDQEADGIIVGRHATREGRHIVRLGGVARRLLRRLDAPVIVAPADLDADGIGKGPIVVGTNLGRESVAAARFGKAMAESLGRRLVVAHTAPLPADYAAHYLPADSLDQIRNEHHQAGKHALTKWAAANGLDDVELAVLSGSVVDRLITYAHEHDAAMLVAGSRRLSPVERLLLTSVGSELAASATCMVAVVPPAE